MHRWAMILIIGSLLGVSEIYPSTMEATTRDGRVVILSPDGTWRYKEERPAPSSSGDFTKPESATAVLKSQKGFLEIWYDPDKWQTPSGIENASAELSFRHHAGDAYAMIIVERAAIPIDTLRQIGLDNAKKVAPDAKVTSESERKVNGVTVLSVEIDATTKGIPIHYYIYYWSGKAGAVQLITFTAQNLFEEYKPDLEGLLNGMIIKKP